MIVSVHTGQNIRKFGWEKLFYWKLLMSEVIQSKEKLRNKSTIYYKE